jgi:hypothetical protein
MVAAGRNSVGEGLTAIFQEQYSVLGLHLVSTRPIGWGVTDDGKSLGL